MGWQSRHKNRRDNIRWSNDSLAYGCAYGVVAVITLVVVVPVLVILQLYFPHYWWLWMLLGTALSFYIFVFIYIPAIEKTKAHGPSEVDWEELKLLRKKYPNLWRQVVQERLEQGLLATIRHALRGSQRSMDEEFLERVRQLESSSTTDDERRN